MNSKPSNLKNQIVLSEREQIEIRKLAIEVSSKHDMGIVVGVSGIIEDAAAIADYILSAKMPPLNTVE